MKLLPGSVNPVDPSRASDVSNSLVPLAQREITTRTSQAGLVPSADTFAWSSGTRRGSLNYIDGIPVEDSQSDESARSSVEYVSGSAWNYPVARTAAAQYLFYATGPADRRGRLIDLYA